LNNFINENSVEVLLTGILILNVINLIFIFFLINYSNFKINTFIKLWIKLVRKIFFSIQVKVKKGIKIKSSILRLLNIFVKIREFNIIMIILW